MPNSKPVLAENEIRFSDVLPVRVFAVVDSRTYEAQAFWTTEAEAHAALSSFNGPYEVAGPFDDWIENFAEDFE